MQDLELMQRIVDGLREAQAARKTPAFAYDRISDKVQSEGLSLAYQESHAAQYSERNKIQIIHYFTVVESAKKEGRKVFNRMIDTALQFGVKDLIFKNTDRMSRNYHDLIRIEELVEKHDFNIHFYQTYRTLNKKSTYADKFVLNVEIAAARQLSDKLSHDTKENQLFKARNGIAPLGSPIGYKYDKKQRMHVIDIEIEAFMRKFFDTYDTGTYSLSAFADWLNQQGYKSPTGASWRISNVHYLLTNPFYHGEFFYSGWVWPGKHQSYYNKKRFYSRLNRMGTKDQPIPERLMKYHVSGRKVNTHEFFLQRCSVVQSVGSFSQET